MLDYIISMLLSLPIVLFSLSWHEAAHGFVADKLGDPTAKNLGRVSLNPIKHLDPIGFVAMLVLRIGWAKPVPINTRNFKNPRRDMALTGAAGPISNLILALINFLVLWGLTVLGLKLNMTQQFSVIYSYVLSFFYLAMYLNICLAVFNLIPAPPFDGSRIFYVFLPVNLYFKVMKYERYIGLGIIAVVLLLSRFGISPVAIVADFLSGLLLKLVGLR